MAVYKVEICGVNTSKLPLLTEKEKKEYRKLTLPCTKCIIKLQRELRIFMNVPLFQM